MDFKPIDCVFFYYSNSAAKNLISQFCGFAAADFTTALCGFAVQTLCRKSVNCGLTTPCKNYGPIRFKGCSPSFFFYFVANIHTVPQLNEKKMIVINGICFSRSRRGKKYGINLRL